MRRELGLCKVARTLRKGALFFGQFEIHCSRPFQRSSSAVRLRVDVSRHALNTMSRTEFAHQIIVRSQKFASYVAPYPAPKNIRGSRMRPGEYNSSSYVAGLLGSVMRWPCKSCRWR